MDHVRRTSPRTHVLSFCSSSHSCLSRNCVIDGALSAPLNLLAIHASIDCKRTLIPCRSYVQASARDPPARPSFASTGVQEVEVLLSVEQGLIYPSYCSRLIFAQYLQDFDQIRTPPITTLLNGRIAAAHISALISKMEDAAVLPDAAPSLTLSQHVAGWRAKRIESVPYPWI